MFLALRQAPHHSLPRLKLIEKAIELDKKIGNELQLPRVFRGKTPKNSASATLTNNSDRYFISYRPEGSRNTHFKLAYEPGNVDQAVTEYQKWCKKLVEHDWPFCFGVPKEKDVSETTSHYHTPISHPEEEMDISSPHHEGEDKEILQMSQELTNQVYIEKYSSPIPSSEQSPSASETTTTANDNTTTTNTTTTVNSPSDSSSGSNTPMNTTPMEEEEESANTTTATTTTTSTPPPAAAAPPAAAPTKSKKQPIPPEPFIALEELDLSNIPVSWRDIVEVAPSRIPGGGNGLFAKRKLPYNTPIGFYFGVPMSEDEFDALKDRVGRSSEYSIMYRRTVLDATDDSGEPIMDPDSPRFCPFHFMNETSSQKTASVAFVEGAIVNQIICWTKKVIEQGEELLVWYGKDVHRYWTEEEEEANRKKEQKEQKIRQVQERKQDRLIQKQEKLRLIEEKRERKEKMKLQKLEEERLRKLRKEEERKLKKEKPAYKKKEKKTIVELEAPEDGEFKIVDETPIYFPKDEYERPSPPGSNHVVKKELVFVVSTSADMERTIAVEDNDVEIKKEEEIKKEVEDNHKETIPIAPVAN